MNDTITEQRTRCEVWTRVMGYHRPVSHFNIGKKSEHYSRKHFTQCAAANSQFVKQFPAMPSGASPASQSIIITTTQQTAATIAN